MKVYGCYEGTRYRSFPIAKGSQIAIEVSIAWTEGYSRKESDTEFVVWVRSGCYMLQIMEKNGDYLSMDKAAKLVRKIATEDIVFLDYADVAFFDAIDTTPDEYYVRNALDEEYNEIPLNVEGV